MIDVYPRYARAAGAARRRRCRPRPTRARRRARFTADDLRDLQVWHKLAWIDPFYLDDDARVRALVAKGRGFTEEDKATLRDGRARAAEQGHPRVPRRGRARADRDLDVAVLPPDPAAAVRHRRLPADASRLARCRAQRFAHPEDAAEQLERAAACHERLFGRRPVGLWPSEGSVSDAMVPLVAAAGFRWMATDEQILARTLGADVLARRPRPRRAARAALHAVSSSRAGGASVACGFRDHALSDLIGFTYAGWPADAAADDFVGRLVEAGRRYRGADRRGRGDHPHHPRRRERLGALRGRRPAVPAGALPAAVRPSRAADRDDGRGLRGRRDASCRASFPAPGSTRTSTSGSATPTTSGPGASWPMPATRSTTRPPRRRRRRRWPRRAKRC